MHVDGLLYLHVAVDDDYQALVDKYATVRKDFETHMTESCKVSISQSVIVDFL